MPDEDVHHSKCALTLLEMEQDVSQGPRPRRFSISRLIHGIAIKASGGECFAKTKQHLFRAAVSVSEECNGMRTRRRGEKSKRGCVCGQHHFFHANARVNHARECNPCTQAEDGRHNNPQMST